MPLPLALVAALGEKQQILDYIPDREMFTNLEHARHRLVRADSIFSEPPQCRDVVCQDYSSFICCPGQQIRIVDPRKAVSRRRTKSSSGRKRSRPREIAPLKFASAMNRSIRQLASYEPADAGEFHSDYALTRPVSVPAHARPGGASNTNPPLPGAPGNNQWPDTPGRATGRHSCGPSLPVYHRAETLPPAYPTSRASAPHGSLVGRPSATAGPQAPGPAQVSEQEVRS